MRKIHFLTKGLLSLLDRVFSLRLNFFPCFIPPAFLCHAGSDIEIIWGKVFIGQRQDLTPDGTRRILLGQEEAD